MAEDNLASQYEQTRARIVALVTDTGPGTAAGSASAAVPACPGWTVRDVLAHVTALYADVMAGNIAGAGTDKWTAAQVEARRGRTVDDILAEWDDAGPRLAAMLDDFPGWYGHQVVADLTVHEHDILGAIDRSGERRSPAVDTAVAFLLRAIVGPGAASLGLGPVQISDGRRCWVVGTGDEPAGGADAAAAIAAAIASGAELPPTSRPPVACVTADRFELFRAFTGRLSGAQIRRFDWTADPAPYLALFDLWPFTLRADDLVE